MKRKVITTSDGSSSLQLEDWDETYHSTHGAVQEALHVYINQGFTHSKSESVRVLEMGFGSGLNALLTSHEALQTGRTVFYDAVEGFPLNEEEIQALNYGQWNGNDWDGVFAALHQAPWEVETAIHSLFSLRKLKRLFEDLVVDRSYDLIYFDVFGYPYQPELWSAAVFHKMFAALVPGGTLVTYACRGPIKRAMKEAGFTLEILAGPPGKREMLRATKT